MAEGSAYPKQTELLHARVLVAYGSNLLDLIGGQIVRQDAEEPRKTIIIADDGRVMLGHECVYTVDEDDSPQITAENVEEHRQAIEREINERIAAAEDWPAVGGKAEAKAIAEELAGADWTINIHAPHGKRPQVFVGRFLGEYQPSGAAAA